MTPTHILMPIETYTMIQALLTPVDSAYESMLILSQQRKVDLSEEGIMAKATIIKESTNVSEETEFPVPFRNGIWVGCWKFAKDLLNTKP